MKKINDYTFNISINSNNKRIFTENNSKTNINENKNENNKINNIGEKERNGSINNRIKNDINFARKINYNEKCKSQKEEIITYKISSISKNQLQEISNNIINCKDIQKDDILSNYNSSNLLKRKSDSNRIISNNCLTNSDEKNHNYISIINITNNAPIQNKQMTIGEEEKIYNIDNFENENCDDLKINTLKIKNNILNELDENNDFDINNNNYFLTKEIEENHDDIKKIKKINNNNKKSVNSKSIYKIDLTKYLNKNSEINDINEERSNDRNLTINITSLDNKKANHQYHNIYDSNLSSSNQIFSNSNNTLSPSKCHKCDFKNKNDFFNNVDNSTTLKVTKTKEVDLKEIKNNKLNDILNGRKLSKSLISYNIKIGKAKLLSNSRDKMQNNENKNSKEKLNKINDKINKGKVTSQGSNSLNKMKKINLSLDKIEINKKKLKSKLSPNVIRKLKLINLPIPKNNNLKSEHNINCIKKSVEKKSNNNYTFYQYINSINLDNKYISLTKQSLCYYRIYNINNKKINLDDIASSNIEKIGFYKGYISIILKSDLLQFIPKINNNNEISIKLKNIIGIQLEQYMLNIINQIEADKKTKDITENKNNLFLFNLLLTDFAQGKIECVFDNFEIFMFWMKFLEQISEYYRNNDNNMNVNFILKQ